jgi:hypothetical protein
VTDAKDHGLYLKINYERIWLTVEQQLDPLERVVQRVLADMDATEASAK